MPGYTVGMLAQEPPLNEAKTVLGNIEEAVAETKAKLARFNEIAEQMATDYSDELMEEMGKLQEELDHADAWDIDSQLELAMDALRCPPPDADVTQLSGGERRRVALCKLLLRGSPTCCCSTSRPTTWTPRACSGWSSTWPSTPARSSRSPTTGTSWTTWPSGSSSSTAAGRTRTRATTRPTWTRRPQRLAVAGPQGRQAAEAPDRRARVGPLQRQGPPDQVQGAARPLRGDGHRGGEDPQARLRGDPDPAGPAPGQHR